MTISQRGRLIVSFLLLALVTVLVIRQMLNREVVDTTMKLVSQGEPSLTVCELKSNQISSSCKALEGDTRERALRAIRLGKSSEMPSHGSRVREYLLKVTNFSNNSSTKKTTCFVLAEYGGFESDLYLLPIDAGSDCSGGTFKYLVGAIRVSNFLR